MEVLWVNPSFLDYRVPVYQELNDLLDGQLTLIYSKERTPERVIKKIESVLGTQAIGLTGEKRFEFGRNKTDMANEFIRIPYQSGLLSKVMQAPADVVIGEGYFQWTPVALIKRFVQTIPLVIAYERTQHTERNCPRWRACYRKLMNKYVDAMLCSGIQCRDYVISLGMDPSRITLGHMVADTGQLSQSVAAIDPEKREVLRRELKIHGVCYLYIARLNERKGIKYLIEAWNIFEKNHPNGTATLLLIGDGPQRQDIEDMIARHNLQNVSLLGHIDYDQIAQFYAVADVFILPTLEDNWALVVPEAMSTGLPIICSRYTGGWPELIHNGENGWTFDPLNVNSTLNHLELCYLSRDRLPRMGEVSKEIIKGHTPYKAALSIIEGCKIALEHRNGHNRKSPQSEDKS